jgi:hypothetical protein
MDTIKTVFLEDMRTSVDHTQDEERFEQLDIPVKFSDPRESCRNCANLCSDHCDSCDWNTNPYGNYTPKSTGDN